MPKENRKEENKKIVIIVGAGASCDFVATQEKKFNENHGDIKFEIWQNNRDSENLNSDKNAQYFLSENNRKSYSFPSGEALIKKIGDPREVFNFFGNKILDEIYEDCANKIDWGLENDDPNFTKLNKDFLKYFFEYLKNPNYQEYSNKMNNIVKKFNIFDQPFVSSISRYRSQLSNIINNHGSRDSEFKKFNTSTEFPIFIEKCIQFNLDLKLDLKLLEEKLFNQFRDSFGLEMNYLKELNNNIQKVGIEFNYIDSQYKFNDDIGTQSLKNLIFKVSTSPFLLISHLVYYYQPFSIDELLDSIKTKKIDIFKPLELEPLQLKSILKDSENKTENELENQFRNELIDAGKTLMALFLLRSEKRDLFDNPNPEINSKIWYRHVRNLIINSGKNPKEIKKQIQNLTIISFNYDRSLDYYLRTKLSDYYSEIKERIIYPYGKLAEDNWEIQGYGSFDKNGFNPYSKEILEKIQKLGKNLKVIGDLGEKNEEIKKLLHNLNQSGKIYLLGFAFHQQNCDLLQLKNFKDNKEIYWTNYDDSKSIDKKIENIFGDIQLDKKKFYPSIKKGVYDALIHDFNIDFN